MNEKYADPVTQELLDMASLLDPRFKTKYIKPATVDYIKTKAGTWLPSRKRLLGESPFHHLKLQRFLLRKREVWAASSKLQHAKTKLSPTENPLNWSQPAISKPWRLMGRPTPWIGGGSTRPIFPEWQVWPKSICAFKPKVPHQSGLLAQVGTL